MNKGGETKLARFGGEKERDLEKGGERRGEGDDENTVVGERSVFVGRKRREKAKK